MSSLRLHNPRNTTVQVPTRRLLTATEALEKVAEIRNAWLQGVAAAPSVKGEELQTYFDGYVRPQCLESLKEVVKRVAWEDTGTDAKLGLSRAVLGLLGEVLRSPEAAADHFFRLIEAKLVRTGPTTEAPALQAAKPAQPADVRVDRSQRTRIKDEIFDRLSPTAREERLAQLTLALIEAEASDRQIRLPPGPTASQECACYAALAAVLGLQVSSTSSGADSSILLSTTRGHGGPVHDLGEAARTFAVREEFLGKLLQVAGSARNLAGTQGPARLAELSKQLTLAVAPIWQGQSAKSALSLNRSAAESPTTADEDTIQTLRLIALAQGYSLGRPKMSADSTSANLELRRHRSKRDLDSAGDALKALGPADRMRVVAESLVQVAGAAWSSKLRIEPKAQGTPAGGEVIQGVPANPPGIGDQGALSLARILAEELGIEVLGEQRKEAGPVYTAGATLLSARPPERYTEARVNELASTLGLAPKDLAQLLTDARVACHGQQRRLLYGSPEAIEGKRRNLADALKAGHRPGTMASLADFKSYVSLQRLLAVSMGWELGQFQHSPANGTYTAIDDPKPLTR